MPAHAHLKHELLPTLRRKPCLASRSSGTLNPQLETMPSTLPNQKRMYHSSLIGLEHLGTAKKGPETKRCG